MKKRILLITFILIILLTSLITLYILNKKYNEQNAISKLKLDIIDDNIINEDVILESYTDENNIENKEQETIIQNDNNKNNVKETSQNQENVTESSKKAENKTDNSLKNNTTSQQKINELTVESAGEYDIKNGGSATYSNWVEVPKDWLDF